MTDVIEQAGPGASTVVHRGMQKVQFLTRPDAGRLYTALTVPTEADPSLAVLFCPPAFDEHSRAYPIMREYSRRLATRAIATLRFDYFATGDSEGSSNQFTMRSGIADISFLLSWLAERFPAIRIVPMGVRLGARLMLDALSSQGAELAARLATPILWDPMVDVRSYIFSELRATLSSVMFVYQAQVASREDIIRETLEKGFCERRGYKLNHIDGYPISGDFLREVGLDVSEPPTWSYPEPVSVLTTVRAAGAGERSRRQLADMLPKMEFHEVEDMPYWYQQPIYRQTRDKLFAATDECLIRCRA